MKNKKLILLLAPFVITLILSSLKIFTYAVEGYENKKIIKALDVPPSTIDTNSPQFKELSTIEIAKNNIANRKEALKSLQERNSDVIGWIYIKDTKVDYPILQSDDNIKYLDTTLDNNESKYGSIFMDYRNDINNLDNINGENLVIYGHNMKDKQMFGSLDTFANEEFFSNNPIIALLLGDEEYYFQAISVYVTSSTDNYINTNFSTIDEFNDFANKVSNKSYFNSNLNPTNSNLLLTLSTCSYEFNDARLVVHCSLLE